MSELRKSNVDAIHLEAAVLAGGGGDVAVVAAVAAELEAAGQTHVGHYLQRRGGVPHVDQVSLRPAVYN